MRRARAQLLASRARSTRLAPTTTEALLWAELRGSRLGVAFRRQVVIGEYIVDFCAPSVGLVVEVDGGYHAGRARADARRDRMLAQLGYRVVRVPAEAVLRDMAAVLGVICSALRTH